MAGTMQVVTAQSLGEIMYMATTLPMSCVIDRSPWDTMLLKALLNSA